MGGSNLEVSSCDASVRLRGYERSNYVSERERERERDVFNGGAI